MSKFEIYKSKGSSLQQLGLINKIIYILIVVLFPILGFFGTILNKLNIKDFVLYIIIIIWVLCIIALIAYTRYISRNLEKLGDLTIGANRISKSISGLITIFEYDRIQEINVKKHIRNIFFSSNNDSSKTYLVTITDNESKEIFVVSSQSIDKPEVNFLDLLTNLKKYQTVRFKITS